MAKLEKQFLFWDFTSKKVIALRCNPRGYRLQSEVRWGNWYVLC
jgi:hypothetical protein